MASCRAVTGFRPSTSYGVFRPPGGEPARVGARRPATACSTSRRWRRDGPLDEDPGPARFAQPSLNAFMAPARARAERACARRCEG